MKDVFDPISMYVVFLKRKFRERKKYLKVKLLILGSTLLAFTITTLFYEEVILRNLITCSC